MTVSAEAVKVATIAGQAADDKQASNIIALDVADVLAITDIFLIASADNERQVRAIVDEIEDKLTEAGYEPERREGNREFRWVLLDYGHVVIHVQRDIEREFYGLDRLYRDCPVVPLEGLPDPERPGDYTPDTTRTAESIDDIPLAGELPEEEDDYL